MKFRLGLLTIMVRHFLTFLPLTAWDCCWWELAGSMKLRLTVLLCIWERTLLLSYVMTRLLFLRLLLLWTMTLRLWGLFYSFGLRFSFLLVGVGMCGSWLLLLFDFRLKLDCAFSCCSLVPFVFELRFWLNTSFALIFAMVFPLIFPLILA